MLSPGMKSRPVYPGFAPDLNARHNLIALEGEGAVALFEMSGKTPDAFFSRTTILFCPTGSSGKGYEAKLQNLKPEALWVLPTLPTAMFRLKGALANATMATSATTQRQ